tara:strand:+ start:231 stop:1424 length:1194 start_codon:yes stop_codon:yes gene_type:complete
VNTPFYIARRYLVSKSSNNAINVMSFLAAFGVFVSAAALFVVLSGFAGLKDYTLGFVSYASPDLKVEASLGKSFELNKEDYQKLSSLSSFSSIYRAVQERVLIATEKNKQIVLLTGVDKFFPANTIDSLLVRGRWIAENEKELVVGWGVGNNLGLEVFDNINPPVVYAPKPGRGQILAVNDAFNQSSFLTVGTFEINEEKNNLEAFTSLSALQSLLNYKPSEITSLNFYFNGLSQEGVVVEKIKNILGDSFIYKNRLAQHDTLYKMLNTERAAVYLIFTLVIIIALFNVVGALIMMILEKRRDLKTLITLGLMKAQIKQVFFLQGLLISVSGSVFGVLFGFLLVQLQSSFSLFMITPSLAYPVSFSANTFVVVFLTVVFLGGLASKLASSQATKALD